jgi:CubicO group peptidase (beta-lactamase class C family)
MCRYLYIVVLLSSCFTGCTYSKMAWYNFADITDYQIFPEAPLKHSDKPFTFYRSNDQTVFPETLIHPSKGILPLDKFMEETGTVAFLVMRNDTIYMERYYNDYDTTSPVASFSMAKSVISSLIGIAIQEGYIKSVQEPVTNYIPELAVNGYDKVTIEHLLTMTSGMDFNESYSNPFGEAAQYYYGDNLREMIPKLKLKTAPGREFEYLSGNSELLGLVLERALKNKSVTQYLQEKIWTPIGMEFDAGWSIDTEDKGLEKTFCCVNARARDFLKFGRLYLNNGNWNGQQIVPAEWVQASTTSSVENGRAAYYGYQWWLGTNGDFCAIGILGQHIYVNPAKKMVIVRLGKEEGGVEWFDMLSRLMAKSEV